MLGWLRALRRRRLAQRPFPDPWHEHIERHVGFACHLDGELRERFHTHLKVFAWQKCFIGANGMEITDEVRVVISAAAVRLVLHLDLSYYDRLTEIVVYPSHFRHPDADDDTIIYGEAHAWGTVVLSWEAVLHGLGNTRDGHDTATHEFAHVLDGADGSFDGTPNLHQWSHYRAWAEVMSEHFEKLRGRGRAQRKSLRAYGATNEAEFFAVATEAFFEKPLQMREHTPDLYEELVRFYRFDPAGE